MNSQTSSPTSAEWGVFLLRVSLGVLFLAHSIVLKLITYGADGTAQFFVGVGLPGWLAYVTIVWELVGGILLVLGIQTRLVSLILTPILLGALFFVHLANGWVFTNTNGGWEYPAYLFVLCIAQALLGDGPYALSPSRPLGEIFGQSRSVQPAR
ncbi:MAG: DoxX family protein [Hyphomicrobiales bacterium]|nr:DoxX family protein [Hyphomicrobiales bacterium]MBW0005446.1 DoxX family protein [Hyphomicrobiales bacterium]